MKQNKVTWLLEETCQEKGLGVLTEKSLKPTLHNARRLQARDVCTQAMTFSAMS